MMKIMVPLLGAAITLSGTALDARHYSNTIACSGWRDGECVAWNRLTRDQAAKIKVGYEFGPNYTYYNDFNTIPQPIVTQYHLNPDSRYVLSNGYLYVVDPHSYAVTQVITVPNP